MDIPLVTIDRTWHVGTLDPEGAKARVSLEAFMLSVSCHPRDWQDIAGCSGPTWEVSHPGAVFLDVLAMGPEHRSRIVDWGVERGLARRAEIWRAWLYDVEKETWYCLSFDDEARARTEAEETEDAGFAPGQIPSRSGAPVDRVTGVVLETAGMQALGRWPDPIAGLEGLIILWARDLAAKQAPDLVGTWWEETHDPFALSCPRGGIFPECLSWMKIHPVTDPREDRDMEP